MFDEAQQREGRPAFDVPDVQRGPVVDGAMAGVNASVGRDATVWGQLQRFEALGRNAPQVPVDTSITRIIGQEKFLPTAIDPSKGNTGRYNGRGHGIVYAGPDAASAQAEVGAYRDPRNPSASPLQDKLQIELRHRATPSMDARGNVSGGMADVSSVVKPDMAKAMTVPSQGEGPGRLFKLAGESPHASGQAVARGAERAGAQSLKVPSAVVPGGDQINVLAAPKGTPEAARAEILKPTSVARLDASGNATPMPGKEATIQPLPDASAKPKHALGNALKQGAAARSAHGGAAGAATAGLDAVYDRVVKGKEIDGAELATNAAIGAGTGTAAAGATHAATKVIGKAGGPLVGALLSGGMSAYDNIKAYQDGKLSGTEAAANVGVDVGVGVGSGAAGAALGAAIGSIVPGAGTAVGALVGLGVGTLGSWAAKKLADESGFTGGAKKWTAGKLEGAKKWLGGLFGGKKEDEDAAPASSSE